MQNWGSVFCYPCEQRLNLSLMNDKELYSPICSLQLKPLSVYFLESDYIPSCVNLFMGGWLVVFYWCDFWFFLVVLLTWCLRFLHESVGVFLHFKIMHLYGSDGKIMVSSNCHFLFGMTACCSGSRVKHLHLGICMLKKNCVVQFTSYEHQQWYAKNGEE